MSYNQYFLTNDCLHCCSVLRSRIIGIQLVGDRRVIFSVLLDSLLHEPGERRKHVDGRIDLFVVQLTIDEDLSFCDVSSQIWNRMRDVVVLSYGWLTGMDKMGIWVIEPFRPCTLPARS